MNGGGAAWESVWDRCEQVLDRVESLLDEGGVAEALRLLQQNEAELRRVAASGRGAAPARNGDRSGSRSLSDGTLAVLMAADYAPMTSRSARLPLLVQRTGRLLSRCEMMRDQTADELRRLHTNRSFQTGPSVAGTWFAEEA